MRALAYAVLALLALTVPVAALTDADIRDAMIQGSIASYPGTCPCPYSTDRRGRSCGGRSAYSRPGGYAPLYYAQDVSDRMIADYRKSHGG